MPKQKVGFIGLGDMGRPMATRLLDHGWDVTSCVNRRRDTIDALKMVGLSEAESPREVGAASDIVITMVRDADQSRQVIYPPGGALAGMRRGAILIIMSTIGPGACLEIARKAAEQGVLTLDSPVSGLPHRAEQGTLALMVGGETDVLERCRDLLSVMGQIFHCGEVGAGTVAKLANNAVLMGTMALLVETRALARAYDMRSEKLMEIFSNASADSFVVRNWDSLEANWDHYIALLEKDVGLCLEAAGHSDLGMSMTNAASRFNFGQKTT